jgi:hypothetical protein
VDGDGFFQDKGADFVFGHGIYGFPQRRGGAEGKCFGR